ncbi:hypothetical protein C0J52_23184 [Blattella germanica]|nr:hypothetical protein C0J52_23184 [Blattella germanica]
MRGNGSPAVIEVEAYNSRQQWGQFSSPHLRWQTWTLPTMSRITKQQGDLDQRLLTSLNGMVSLSFPKSSLRIFLIRKIQSTFSENKYVIGSREGHVSHTSRSTES